MRFFKTALFILTLFISNSLPLADCRAENADYAFIIGSRGNSYWTAVADGIREAAQAKNIDAAIYQTESDRDAEGELNLCQTVIQRKPKLLVMQAINVSVGLECFKQAVAAGIIVADIDAHLTIDDAKTANLSLAYTVGSDNFRIGQEAAKYVAKNVKSSSPKIFVLEGAVGSLTAEKRADGFRAKLKELMPTAHITSLTAEWDMLKAVNATSDFLMRQPDANVIYAANDMMALGAAEAVRSAGKQAQITIIGVDGTSDARKAIKEGKLSASVAQLPYLMGKRAVELGIDAVKGGKTNVVEVTPTLVLTKELIEANKDPLLQYVR